MESKLQNKYEAFEAKIASMDPFINDLIVIGNRHQISNEDLQFVAELFKCGSIPPIESFREAKT